MKLISLDYVEYEDQTYKWTLHDFTLIDINLIVGKNAIGKSRILRIINALARLIDGSRAPSNVTTGRFKAVFETVLIKSNKRTKQVTAEIVYELEIYKQRVQKEILMIDGVLKLQRKESGRGDIWFDKQNDYIDIQVPETNLVVSSRRDPQQHKFFEDLHGWASGVKYYEFAHADQEQAMHFDKKAKIELGLLEPIKKNINALIKFGKDKYGRTLVSNVVSDMRKIGYEISDFGLMPVTGISSPLINFGSPEFVYIKEEGIDKRLPQNEISTGMYRALVTLVLLHVVKLEKKPGCLLIDDIGEGLDFERSTKLISVIISHVEEGHSQVVMTTNDRFVMNKVELKYWCVIQREAGTGTVVVYNPRNSKEAFSDFEEFGFNNFDFFSKNFFSQSIKDIN